MKLIKHFDFTNMTQLDANDWTIAVGDKWPNKEIQHYVNKPTSLYFDENGLNIRAVMNQKGLSDHFNSGSLLWEEDAITTFLNDWELGGLLKENVVDADFPLTFTVKGIKVYS